MGGKQGKGSINKKYCQNSLTTDEPISDEMEQKTETSNSVSTPKTAIVVGAGARGSGYSLYAKMYPDRLKIFGVCEPREFQRTALMKAYGIPVENAFEDWKDAVKRKKFADCVFICTPDRLHKDPAVAFAKKGYHVLLEKPMAVTEEDCKEIVSTCKENHTLLSVCHVLRYTPWVQKVKQIIDSGDIGDVVNINHTEPVGFWHFAHSYVRGNWRNKATSSFSLLAKCCHDVDLICFWMNKKCERVSSFGNLSHFHKKDKPEGAGDRCLSCPSNIEENCPYSAKKIYLDSVKRGCKSWPTSVISDIVDIENVTKALQTGPYGKCVYDTDNDVVSHQVVNMQFEGGATCTLQMVAFTQKICAREVKIHGTKGEISVKDGRYPPIKVFDFLTKNTTEYEADCCIVPGLSGHGGADYHTVEAFVDALHNPDTDTIATGPDNTLTSHLLCFAAERSRLENRVLNRNSLGEYE
ncbi:hypothetical protein ACF0H5_014713 [Mactra antiquata]